MSGQAHEEWTLATVRAAVELVTGAHGLGCRVFFVRGPGMGSLRVEVIGAPAPGSGEPAGRGIERMTDQPMLDDLDTREVTCWLELPCSALDAADAEPDGVAELVSREVTAALLTRHGRGAAA